MMSCLVVLKLPPVLNRDSPTHRSSSELPYAMTDAKLGRDFRDVSL